MSLNITNVESVFDFENKPDIASNAKGGTELMMKWLREQVDHDLLDQFQIIPTRVRSLDPDKKRILWVHDTCEDPEVQHLKDPKNRDVFDMIVYVSHWQKQQFEDKLGIPPSKGIVLKNAIYPIPEHKKPPKDTINIIYHTTPHRGLELVYHAVREIVNNTDLNVHLDVYSSFGVYGWEERDKQYTQLFEDIKSHPNMTYHGAQSNDTVRKALEKAHIFAYPSVWTETSCIALIEAMSAGCFNVCSSLGALPETAANLACLYPYTEDIDTHYKRFRANLVSVIETVRDSEELQHQLDFQKTYFDAVYNWDVRKHEWIKLLTELKD